MDAPSPTATVTDHGFVGLDRDVLVEVAGTVGLAVATTVLPLAGQLISPAVGVPIALLMAFGIANHLPRAVPAVAVFATLFQNTFVSLLSPWIVDAEAFTFIRGYAFLSTVMMWLTLTGAFLLRPQDHGPLARRLMRHGLIVLGLIGVYAAIGLVTAGSSAIVYTRNIVTPILLLHLALLTAGRARLDMGRIYVVYALILFSCGWIEMVSRPTWMALTNGDGYWAYNAAGLTAAGYWEDLLKQTGFVYRDMDDFFRINLFNTPWLAGIEVMRLHGPNIHAIAFGYALAFMALFLLASGRPFVAALALPLLVLASAKGAMLLVVFVVFAWGATRLLGPKPALAALVALLAAYAVANFVSGLAAGDYHVIGLVGGLKGFAGNPIGRGIGAGGNLGGTISLAEWSKAQDAGAFEGAVESAIGVLLYQMGVAAFLVLAYYLEVAREAWRRYVRSRLLHQGLAGFGILVVVVNGLFQEEALFSPLALGLLTGFAGLVLGAAERVERGSSWASARER